MRTMMTLAFVALCGTAFAHDKVIKESDVPAPVLASVKKKYPTAKLNVFEMEGEGKKTSYEIKLTTDGKDLDVVCDPDGKITATEEKIDLASVPEPVKKALAAHTKYGSWTFNKAERIVEASKPDAFYEVKVVRGNVRAELTFTAAGKLTHTEEQPWPKK